MNEPRGRPFPPGNTMGRGRPKGSRNKANSEGQDLLDKYTAHLVGNCIAGALRGDQSAMRICMDRISPARRNASIRMSMPRIKTAQDLEKAAEKITQAIGRGRIAPVEGETMMNILEIRSRLIEKGQYESRIEKLEESVAAVSRLPGAPEAGGGT